ncbi:nuclear transport factor 2 family protein [Pseudomonas aeruginosa]|uniref:nuclear transport factor 2 family protein n=2 Tax=Pseudomonas aeruginosa TaxID=287 RepID=UPI002751A65D|nr:nuclear transport factor 2 family protein [Pseudomonas aeruginosa]
MMAHRHSLPRMLLAFGLLALASMTCARASEATTLVDRYVAAWNNHDAQAAARLLDERFSYFNSSVGERAGKQSIVSVIQSLLTLMPDLHLRLVAPALESGDTLAFEWEFSGTAIQDRKRRPVRLRGASFMRIEAGKLLHLSDYYNAQSMREQLAP